MVSVIGIIIFAGFLGGQVAAFCRLTRVTGFLLVGILLSPSLFNIIPKSALADLDFMVTIGLGIIGFQIGGHIRIVYLKTVLKSIVWITALQSFLPFFFTILLLVSIGPFLVTLPNATLINTYFPMALVLGAIACSSAPAAIMAICRECYAKGPMTSMVLAVLAITDVVTVVAFSIAINIAEILTLGNMSFSAYEMLSMPLIYILKSFGIGILFAIFIIFISLTKVIKNRPLLLVCVLGTIILCTGASDILGASNIMTTMVLGFILANRSGSPGEIFSVIEDIEILVFNIFFVLNGLYLDLNIIQKAGLLTFGIIAARITGKYFGCYLGAGISGTTAEIKKYSGIVLLPKAGLSLGLAFAMQATIPTFGPLAFNAMLASIVINMLFTPPLVRYAFVKAGESISSIEDIGIHSEK